MYKVTPRPHDEYPLQSHSRHVLSMLFSMAHFSLVALLFIRATLGLCISDGDFFDPAQGGGSWLDSGDGTSGEPLNVRRSSSSYPHE